MLTIRHTKDTVLEVGVDEAGRGCLFGPLYAGACIWTTEEEMTEEQKGVASQIKDSKKLSAKRRNVLAQSIKDLSISWAVGSVSAKEIDEIGITKANQLAFSRALEGLSLTPERILIDGTLGIHANPWCFVEQIVEPELDNKYVPVAAASILAKTEHDKWIEEFCNINSNIAELYDLSSNKGYGTVKHRKGILEHGHHSLHRQLFLRKLYASKTTTGDSNVE